MIILPAPTLAALRRNAGEPTADPAPVVKLFNPAGPATWLATALGPDGDTLFGLADLGFGCPERGYFSLAEIAAIRLPFGLRIERDRTFITDRPLSVWTGSAQRLGSIMLAEAALSARVR